jgi:hypothetical protein
MSVSLVPRGEAREGWSVFSTHRPDTNPRLPPSEHGFLRRLIGFLSVDVEGHDLEALRLLEFDLHKPTLVSVELSLDIRKWADRSD